MSGIRIIMDESIERVIQKNILTLERCLENAYSSLDSFIIERLLSGFSGAVIVSGKPLLKAGLGRPKNAIIKIALERDIQKEYDAYKTFVCKYLPNGTFPHLIHKQNEAPEQCLIYELAFDESQSIIELRELIQIVPDIAIDKISHLFMVVVNKWYSNPSVKYGNVWNICLENELREVNTIEETFYKAIWVKIPDRFYSSIFKETYDNPFKCLKGYKSSDLQNFRYLEVITHGDLNARNVLIDRKTQKINLIDFTRTDVGHFCCDFAKLETVIVTELFSQLHFGKKLALVRLFVDKLELEDSDFLQLASQFQLDYNYHELFRLVKAIRNSFINTFNMPQQEELFKNYKVSLMHFLLRSLTYIDVPRSDKLLAFWEVSYLIGSLVESTQRIKDSKAGPIYAIEEIERLSASFVKQLKGADLSLIMNSTDIMRQQGTISDLDFYRTRAKIKYSKGEWDSAFQEYQKLMEIAKSGGHMWYLSDAFLGIGLIEHVKGKIYVGRDYFMRARTIKEEQCPYDLEGLAEVYMRLGWGEEDIGGVHDSIDYYEKALEYARKSREVRVVVDALHDLGVVCWKEGLLDRAKSLFEEGYELANSVEMHMMMAYHLLGLARVAWHAGEPRSIAFFNKSIGLFREMDYKRGLAIALTEYGDFLISQRELETSMSLLSEAKSIKLSLQEIRELYITETIIGANLTETGDLDEAWKLLTHTIQGFESLGVHDVYKKRCKELIEKIEKQRSTA
ncbi:MAG: phosphotransferase [Proteobacteria bacterium]|nr:phosphotransferase [Pseudomonadota bacterium]